MNLQGARVLLTGASGGIGVEVLGQLLQQGARVAVVSRDTGRLQAEFCTRFGSRELLLIRGDLTDRVFRANAVERAAEWGGGALDVLVNAAGAADFALLDHQAGQGIEFITQLNLVAPMDLTRIALPWLARSARGLIVNVGSVFGAIGYPGNAVYGATKFGLRGFSEALRRELADTSIRVLYVAPRATRTPMNPPAVDELNRKLGNRVDEPAAVAGFIIEAMRRTRSESTFGWPEKLLVRVNALLPRLVDGAIGSKLSIIKHFARRDRIKELS